MVIDYETLNKSFNEILGNVHKYYVEAFQKKQTLSYELTPKLRNIYKPILDYPILTDNVLWFNAWLERDDGSLSIHRLLENLSSEVSQHILERVFSHHKFKDYVTSMRDINLKFKKKDLSCVISNCNDSELDALGNLPTDMFFHIKFKEISDCAFMGTCFKNLHKSLKQCFQNDPRNGLDKTIRLLKEQYSEILNNRREAIENLKKQLQAFSIKDLNNQELARMVNYFFWIKLAYPENWKMLIALPGIIAKEAGSVPMGMNIGFKKIVPLEIIYFLKNAVLIFFTRKSVDFFEEKAIREKEDKIRAVNNLNRLLSDFQHTILQSIIDSIRYFREPGDNLYHSYIDKLLAYISQRGTYIDQLSNFISTGERSINVRAVKFNLNQFKSEFIESGIFLKKISASNISESIDKWKNLFAIDPTLDIDIEGICWGPIQTMIENLIINSINYAFNNEENKIYTRFCKFKNDKGNKSYSAIIYWDNGKGFKKEAYESIPKWYKWGPASHEEKEGIGYGYWLIGKIMDHVKGELKLLMYDGNNSLKKLNGDILDTAEKSIINTCNRYLQESIFKLNKLHEENLRVIHILIFKNKCWENIPT